MTRVQIYNTGSIGIIKSNDSPSHSIPPEAWSDGGNMRFRDKKAIKFKGHDQVFSQATLAGYWLLSVPSGGSNFWINAGLTAVEVVQTTTQAIITRGSGAYSASSNGQWNGGLLGSVAILNNYQDVPQFWATASMATLLADLTYWPAGYRARVVRTFKNFIVAMGITTAFGLPGEVVYANRVLISQPADPGQIPSTWDATDETGDVVDDQLSDDQDGQIIYDGMGLGNDFIIYKQGSTWRMSYVGGTFVQKFTQVFETQGILTTNCVAALPKGKGHFVYTGEDLVIHDGQNSQSVVDGKMRQFIKNSIDATYYYRSYCVQNVDAKEMWFCFPESGYTLPSLAVTYSFVDGSIGLRTLSNVAFMASGFINEAGSQEIWDNVDTLWDNDELVWDQQVTTQYVRGILGTDPTLLKLFRFDNTETFNGSSFTAFLERTGISIIGRDRQGQPQLDFTRNKIVQRVWPKISGGPVSISIGMQDTIDGSVTWSTPVTFDPATDQYVDPDPPPNGRLPAIRISSTGSVTWNIDGYDIEMELIGTI